MDCCPDCGKWVPSQELADGIHYCDPELRIEFQVLKARRELKGLEWELSCYLRTPRARKLLAFTKYLEQRESLVGRPAT